MNGVKVDMGLPAVLAFRGPDAVRYLNGQVTQDVRAVVGSGQVLPACVTDAKGRVQFRVWIREGADGELLVDCQAGTEEELAARLTKYLIADDVEVEDRTGGWRLLHVMGGGDEPSGLKSRRFGVDGRDLWWAVEGEEPTIGLPAMGGDAFEDFRIRHLVPVQGHEVAEGVFPSELGLEDSDVSFHKGCYIGQEVISRIRSVGKVNRRLSLLAVDGSLPPGDWELLDAGDKPCGVVTSISPLVDNGMRRFLALVRRDAEPRWVSVGGLLSKRAQVAPPR